jgi:hypothetical protein
VAETPKLVRDVDAFECAPRAVLREVLLEVLVHRRTDPLFDARRVRAKLARAGGLVGEYNSRPKHAWRRGPARIPDGRRAPRLLLVPRGDAHEAQHVLLEARAHEVLAEVELDRGHDLPASSDVQTRGRRTMEKGSSRLR